LYFQGFSCVICTVLTIGNEIHSEMVIFSELGSVTLLVTQGSTNCVTVLGLVVTIIMVYVLQRGQPALLYLVPFTMIPTAITSYSRKQFHLLCQGIKERDEDRNIEEGVAQEEVTASLLTNSE
jgi:hypothetical protein